MRSLLLKIRDGILGAFFPEGIKCVCCGDELNASPEYCVCRKCRPRIPFTDENICLKCGVALDNMSDFCQTCKFAGREFTLARAPLIYSGSAAKLVKDFKAGDKFLAPHLADIMADYYEKELLNYNIECVSYVPSDSARIKARGYNQSETLAALLCEKTGLPLLHNTLAETRRTKKQALLPAAERAENVAGAYKISEAFDRSLLKNKTVMLIDDIFTTGSTAGECAKTLKKGGAKEVYVFTLATGRGK